MSTLMVCKTATSDKKQVYNSEAVSHILNTALIFAFFSMLQSQKSSLNLFTSLTIHSSAHSNLDFLSSVTKDHLLKSLIIFMLWIQWTFPWYTVEHVLSRASVSYPMWATPFEFLLQTLSSLLGQSMLKFLTCGHRTLSFLFFACEI